MMSLTILQGPAIVKHQIQKHRSEPFLGALIQASELLMQSQLDDWKVSVNLHSWDAVGILLFKKNAEK